MREHEEDLLDRREAAEYCRVSVPYLVSLARPDSVGGPPWVRTSPKKTLYQRSDLDAWMASWVRHTPCAPRSGHD
jgi:hypothetical protein